MQAEARLFETDDKIGSSPAVTDNAVYFGLDDNYIYALKTSNGSLIWKYKSNHPIGTIGNEIIAVE